MLKWIVSVFALLVACGERANPNVCCVTEAQCEDLGANELRPCGMGQACSADHSCIAAECSDNGDCSDEAPICRLGFCESTCGGDEDCADVAGRTHCLEGGCVGCTMSDQCTGTMAICDGEDHTCRGCERDDECASGVCIDTQGRCALETELRFVRTVGGADAGDCLRGSPCATLTYAVSRVTVSTATRNVIRIEGGAFNEPSLTTVSITFPIVLDGSGTTVEKPSTGALLSVQNGGTLTISGLTLVGTESTTSPTVDITAGSAILGPGTVLRGALRIANATATLESVRAESVVACANGTLDVHRSAFSMASEGTAQLYASGCQSTVRQSTFAKDAGGMVEAMGGLVVIENSLFVNNDEYAEAIRLFGGAQGSRFHFNTIVNMSGLDADGEALMCDATYDVANNLFAYRSRHPFGNVTGCLAKYSVFDDVAMVLPTPAQNSTMHPFSSLFANASGGDFHLAASSPAIGAADPAATTHVDLEGRARPRPAGAPADVGAYEAP